MPDPLTLGILGGGALSAGGSLASLFGDEPNPRDAITFDLNLRNDPLNVALGFDALAGLGDPTAMRALLERSNPLQQVINRIGEATLSIQQKEAAIAEAVRRYNGGGPVDMTTPEGRYQAAAFNQAVAFGAIPNTLIAQLNPQARDEFNASVDERIAQFSDTGVGEARASALSQLSDYVQSLGGGGSESSITNVAQNVLAQERDDAAQKAIDDVLVRANAGGFNPAGLLAEIEKTRLQEASRSPLLAREFADKDFQNLLAFLNFGSDNARQSASVTNQAALGSAGIAANQLMAANAARQGGSNTADAVGGALGEVGSTLANLGILSGLGGSKPGVGGGGGGFSLGGSPGFDPVDSAVRSGLGGGILG